MTDPEQPGLFIGPLELEYAAMGPYHAARQLYSVALLFEPRGYSVRYAFDQLNLAYDWRAHHRRSFELLASEVEHCALLPETRTPWGSRFARDLAEPWRNKKGRKRRRRGGR